MVSADAAGAIAFLYISLLFAKIYGKLRDDSILLFALSYAFLCLANITAILSAITPDHKLAATYYAATSSLAIAGFIAMLEALKPGPALYTVPFTALLITPDIIAGTLSAIISIKSKHATRLLMALLSLSFIFRGFSTMTAPATSPLLLLIAEILRAFSAVALSLYHVARAV